MPDLETEEPARDPAAEEAAMRRQIETTLRFMRLQTIIGIVVILALIVFVSSVRSVISRDEESALASVPVAICCARCASEICCPSPSELIGWLNTMSDRMSA